MKNTQLTNAIIKDTLVVDSQYIKDSDSLSLQYLGCGGFYIKYKSESVLIDPYFTYHPLLSVPFKKLTSNKNDIEYGLEDVFSSTKPSSILISHSHYDHLFDTPYIVNHYFKDIKIYGSTSTKNILSTVVDTSNVIDVSQKFASESNHLNADDQWIYVNDKMRILFIQSGHGPHFRLLFTFHFHKGQGHKIKGYTNPSLESKANKWKEGDTYSFLIDFIDKDPNTGHIIINERLFIQSSPSYPSLGYPPKEILDERKVDTAIIGGASFNYIKGEEYPYKIIKYLDAKTLVICHWEDFFRPYQEQPKRFVRLTNFKKLFYELQKEHQFYLLNIKGQYKIL
ncbi:MBL fold metallo-hydrolase [Flammeovirga sp. OC4]|uniref:MBL fold metallo-hydrolase n=1 Tax=Flammeovirga sp. OC4 TaxID=1382345 RepID=UPI0012E06AEB|nr:hypothetical protein [Flammeovirga sp. OC4]